MQNILAEGCAAPSPGNQTMTPNAAITYAVNETYTYQCNSGHSFDGESADLTITCTAGGNWSDTTAPVCRGKIFE